MNREQLSTMRLIYRLQTLAPLWNLILLGPIKLYLAALQGQEEGSVGQDGSGLAELFHPRDSHLQIHTLADLRG